MKEINSYIIEKLYLNKDIEISKSEILSHLEKINETIKNIKFENIDENIEIEYLSGIKNDFCDKNEFLKQ